MDTATKRASAMFAGSPWRALLPVPDGTIAAGDRQAVAYLYSGILASEEEVPEAVNRVLFTATITRRAEFETAQITRRHVMGDS